MIIALAQQELKMLASVTEKREILYVEDFHFELKKGETYSSRYC